MARRKSADGNGPAGSGAPAAPGLARSPRRTTPRLDAPVALGAGVSPVVLSTPASGPLRSVGELTRTASGRKRGPGYITKKRKAELANHNAKRSALGIASTTHEQNVVSLRTAVFAVAAKPAPELTAKARLCPQLLTVRGMLTELLIGLDKYDNDADRHGLMEITAALGATRAALLDLPRMRNERSLAQFREHA